MKNKILLLTLTLFCSILFGQQQQQSWTLNSQKISFNNGLPPTLSPSNFGNSSGVNPQSITNSIYDQNGNTVLYVSNFEVYGSNGFIGYLSVNPDKESETEIIPVPNSSCKYYIVYNTKIVVSGTQIGSKVYYAEIDLLANNGNGAIISDQPLPNAQYVSTGLAVSKLNNNSRILYVVGQGTISIYDINNSGISLNNITPIGNFGGLKEVDLSHQGDKLAISSNQPLSIIHLNSTGGIDNFAGNQGNGLSTYNDIAIGVEFSENGTFLYYNSSNGIHQLATGTNQLISNTSDYSNSQLEMGSDSNIYLVANNYELGQISNANTLNPIFSANVLNGATINCGNAFEIRVLPDQVDGADYNTFFQNCCLNNNIKITTPSSWVGCNGNYEEICGPSGINYSYEWWGPSVGGNTSVLLWDEPCFTPSQPGSYLLTITDANGCSNSLNITVLDEIPQPHFDFNSEICVGEIITIDGQGFDNPNYEINWYHDTDLVQQGGTTLLSSFGSGIITVQVGYTGCGSIMSSSIVIKECCPDDMSLVIDCESQTIYIQNFPSNILGGIGSWTFNGDHIFPQPLFSTSINASFGEGIYEITILFELNNGEQCEFTGKIEYIEADCCEQIGPTAIANFVNIESYQTISTIPYGDVEIPVLCDFTLDASNSLCEDFYIINISELDPQSWTTTNIYPWTTFTGSAGNSIDLAQLISFDPGQTYLLTLNVGPNGSTVYLPFIYGLDPDVIIGFNLTVNVDDTPYGPMEIPNIECDLRLDGSGSRCEDSYHIQIAPFDPSTWNADPSIFDQWFSGQAPSSIPIPPNILQPYGIGYYMLTFAVGPIWTPEYVLFWYECENLNGSSDNANRSHEELTSKDEHISLNPNPTNDLVNLKSSFDSGTYHMYDVNGKLIKQDILTSKETSIDLSSLNTGIYFFRIQSEDGESYFKKVIKN